MKQGIKARCIYGIITGLLLLLLQQQGFAQTEIDSAEVSVTYQDNDEQVQAEAPVTAPIVFRSVPDSVIIGLQKRKEFAYANDPAYWAKREEEQKASESWLDWLAGRNWFRYMMLTVLSLLLLFVIIKIAVSNNLFITRGSKKSGVAEENDLLQKNNLPALISEAEAQNDFRLAVRYRYMKVLQDMDERQIIHLNAQSTNWDYVNRLGGHPLKKQFLLLTRAYEYVWYGEFNVSGDQYGYLRTEFQQFENSLSQ